MAGAGRRHDRDRIARDLELSPTQKATVDSLMTIRMAQRRALEDSMRQRMRTFFDSTRAQVDRVLTPAQQAKLRQIFALPDPVRNADAAPGTPGHFISRLGAGKRVLWHRAGDGRPEIVSIVDRSYYRVP